GFSDTVGRIFITSHKELTCETRFLRIHLSAAACWLWNGSNAYLDYAGCAGGLAHAHVYRSGSAGRAVQLQLLLRALSRLQRRGTACLDYSTRTRNGLASGSAAGCDRAYVGTSRSTVDPCDSRRYSQPADAIPDARIQRHPDGAGNPQHSGIHSVVVDRATASASTGRDAALGGTRTAVQCGIHAGRYYQPMIHVCYCRHERAKIRGNLPHPEGRVHD